MYTRPLTSIKSGGVKLVLRATKYIWNKGNNKITELRTILKKESQNS